MLLKEAVEDSRSSPAPSMSLSAASSPATSPRGPPVTWSLLPFHIWLQICFPDTPTHLSQFCFLETDGKSLK